MDTLHLFSLPKWLPDNILPPELWDIIFYWKWEIEMKDMNDGKVLLGKYIDEEDLLPDSVGKGDTGKKDDQKNIASSEASATDLSALVSPGYVRGRLRVVNGGATNENESTVAVQDHSGNETTMALPASAGAAQGAVSVGFKFTPKTETQTARIREARIKGYEGDSCDECGNFTLVRNGTCLKCNTCGATSGCS